MRVYCSKLPLHPLTAFPQPVKHMDEWPNVGRPYEQKKQGSVNVKFSVLASGSGHIATYPRSVTWLRNGTSRTSSELVRIRWAPDRTQSTWDVIDHSSASPEAASQSRDSSCRELHSVKPARHLHSIRERARGELSVERGYRAHEYS